MTGICSPAPGSVSEALRMGLPVIVKAGLKTMAQERYNVEWIREQGVGISIKRINDLPKAVGKLLQPAEYSRMRQRIDKLAIRAVFEIPEISSRGRGSQESEAGFADWFSGSSCLRER